MAIFTRTVYFSLFVLYCYSSQQCFAVESCLPTFLARENLQKLEQANNILSISMYRSLARSSRENVLFSPLSISITFGMLYNGTRSNTAQELQQVLGYSRAELPDEAIHSSFKCLLSQLTNDSSFVINIANAFLLDNHLRAHIKYKNDIRYFYNSAVREVGIQDQPQLVQQAVNLWVRRNTNNKIKTLLLDISPHTKMMLLNAVYFKGKWKKQFDRKKTELRPFTNWMSKTKSVPTMRMKTELLYFSNHQFQALEIPYEGDNTSLFVMLPKKNTNIATFENSLTHQTLTEIREHLQKKKVTVLLPKFSLNEDPELSSTLKELGAGRIFSPYADFSGISSSPNIFVGRIQHKAFVEVNEEGSEAAASTAMVMRYRMRQDPSFVADRPFLFCITWKNVILFMGRVNTI